MAGNNDKRPIIVIKKVEGGHGHHGGAWKVAYADFVTAMMALFMVMWLLAQTDESDRSSIAQYFRTGVLSGGPAALGGHAGAANHALHTMPLHIRQRDAEQEALEREAEHVREALNRAISDDPALEALRERVQIQVTDMGLLIQVGDAGEDTFFELASADLKPQLVEFLEQLAPVLRALPNKIQLHGHTDARPFPRGSERDNWSLSYDRANAARRVLEEHGIDPSRIMGVHAYGSSVPLVDDDPLASENRRLTVLVVRQGREHEAGRGVGPNAPDPMAPQEGEDAED